MRRHGLPLLIVTAVAGLGYPTQQPAYASTVVNAPVSSNNDDANDTGKATVSPSDGVTCHIAASRHSWGMVCSGGSGKVPPTVPEILNGLGIKVTVQPGTGAACFYTGLPAGYDDTAFEAGNPGWIRMEQVCVSGVEGGSGSWHLIPGSDPTVSITVIPVHTGTVGVPPNDAEKLTRQVDGAYPLPLVGVWPAKATAGGQVVRVSVPSYVWLDRGSLGMQEKKDSDGITMYIELTKFTIDANDGKAPRACSVYAPVVGKDSTGHVPDPDRDSCIVTYLHAGRHKVSVVGYWQVYYQVGGAAPHKLGGAYPSDSNDLPFLVKDVQTIVVG